MITQGLLSFIVYNTYNAPPLIPEKTCFFLCEPFVLRFIFFSEVVTSSECTK